MTMAFGPYKDRNGVAWTIIESNNGFTLVGTVLDSADPKYDPPATDQEAVMQQGGVQVGGTDYIHTDPPTTDQTMTLRTELLGKIEQYALEHTGQAMLQVKASPGVPWWVWAGLGFVMLSGRRR